MCKVILSIFGATIAPRGKDLGPMAFPIGMNIVNDGISAGITEDLENYLNSLRCPTLDFH